MKRILYVATVGLMLLVTACQAAPEPTPTETATVEPTPLPTSTIPPTWTPVPPPSPTPADTPTLEPTSTPVPADIWVSSAGDLNLRAEAKADAKVVTTLKSQQHLVVISPSIGPDAAGVTWENVRTDDGQTGWASAQFLTRTNPAATPAPVATTVAAAPTAVPTQAPAATPGASTGEAWTTASDGLNLRAQAVTTATVVAVLPFGTHLALLSAPAGPDTGGITWQNVRTDDSKTGYVSVQFISATKPTTTTTTTPVTTTTTSTTTASVGDVWVITSDSLNLRAEPSSTAAIVTTLTYGQRLTALAPKTAPDAAGIAWQNVRTAANQTGWAAANYLSTTAPTTTTTTTTTTVTPTTGTTVDVTSVLLQRLNDLRRQNKLAPVTLNAQLAAAALRHSQDMARTGNISHVGSDGTTPQQRITAAGFTGQHKDEAIYGGQATFDDAWYFWINDRQHANLLLNPRYTEIGVAAVSSGASTYFTIDFGGDSQP